jgi:methylmalonyl-CoA mutase cobalamin-binding domain/chain
MDLKDLPRKPRMLVGKIGLDGHNRGAYVVAQGLSGQGVEVIYTGLRQTPNTIARAAVQEDVDVIGISSMVGAHVSTIKKLRDELMKLNATDIPITIGGIIPREDYDMLYSLGVKRIFPTGTEVKEIAQYVFSVVKDPVWHCEVPESLTGSLREGFSLLGTHCESCNRTFFPKRKNCPFCMDDAHVKAVPLSRTGTLQSCIVTQAAPPGYPVPHAQGYVELNNSGIRLFTLLTDYDEATLKAGCAMELKCVERRRNENDEAIYSYRFRPIS